MDKTEFGLVKKGIVVTTQPYVTKLLTSLAETLRADQSTELAQFANSIDCTDYAIENPSVLRYLDDVLEMGRRGPLCHFIPLLQSLSELLPWTTFYLETDVTKSFLSNFAIMEIVGPNGPIISQDVIVGLFLLGPHTWYPIHQHAAEEVYKIIAGNVRFFFDGQWVERQAGEHQYMQADVPHALQTAHEPLLTFYTWIGRVRQPVFFNSGDNTTQMPLLPQYAGS